MELIAERMGISTIPASNILSDYGYPAALAPDLETIYFDVDTIRKAKYKPSEAFFFRFSVAHELGHIVLHKGFFDWYRDEEVNTVSAWVQFLRRCHDELFPDWIEWDADEFAGRLLVPLAHLRKALDEVLSELPSAIPAGAQQFKVREFLGKKIHRRFEVNVPVIKSRLKIEGFYPDA